MFLSSKGSRQQPILKLGFEIANIRIKPAITGLEADLIGCETTNLGFQAVNAGL